MTEFTFALEWQCSNCRKYNTYTNPEVTIKTKPTTKKVVSQIVAVVFVSCPHCDADAEFEMP